jgi:glyoxylase-like metal-dependent hydrolase (beta-lactamase superfamily II)
MSTQTSQVRDNFPCSWARGQGGPGRVCPVDTHATLFADHDKPGERRRVLDEEVIGSNLGVVIGKDGAIVIDAKQTPESESGNGRSRQTHAEASDAFVLTHINLDHVDGLPGFPKGLTIIVQKNSKLQIEHPRNNPQNIDLSGYNPTKTVVKKELQIQAWDICGAVEERSHSVTSRLTFQ